MTANSSTSASAPSRLVSAKKKSKADVAKLGSSLSSMQHSVSATGDPCLSTDVSQLAPALAQAAKVTFCFSERREENEEQADDTAVQDECGDENQAAEIVQNDLDEDQDDDDQSDEAEKAYVSADGDKAEDQSNDDDNAEVEDGDDDMADFVVEDDDMDDFIVDDDD